MHSYVCIIHIINTLTIYCITSLWPQKQEQKYARHIVATRCQTDVVVASVVVQKQQNTLYGYCYICIYREATTTVFMTGCDNNTSDGWRCCFCGSTGSTEYIVQVLLLLHLDRGNNKQYVRRIVEFVRHKIEWCCLCVITISSNMQSSDWCLVIVAILHKEQTRQKGWCCLWGITIGNNIRASDGCLVVYYNHT